MAYTRIRQLGATKSEWEQYNPILLLFEQGFEIQSDRTFKIKIGDGVSNWNDMPYAVDFPGIEEAKLIAQDTLQRANDAMNGIDAHVLQIAEDANEVAQDRVQVAADKATTLGYKNAAQQSANDSASSALIAANNILNGVNSHDLSSMSHQDIRDILIMIEAIARGKARAHTFDTEVDMLAWLAIPANTDELQVGDNLYIRDIGVPDYWWDGEMPCELEAEAPSLVNYYTKEQTDARLPEVIEQSDYDALIATGQIIAGKLYYRVPDGTLGGGA